MVISEIMNTILWFINERVAVKDRKRFNIKKIYMRNLRLALIVSSHESQTISYNSDYFFIRTRNV